MQDKKNKKELTKAYRIGESWTLVTHLLVKFIDRRDGKVKGRQLRQVKVDGAALSGTSCSVSFSLHPETDIHP